MEAPNGKFRYVYSSDLDVKVQIKIGTLEGKKEKPEYSKLLEDPMLKFSGMHQSSCPDLCVECQVFSDGRPLALPVMTSYKPFMARWNWNEWVTLPLLYSNLPRNALLALTIYDCGGPGTITPVGGTTVSLFGKHGVFRQGILDLQVWPGKPADGSSFSCTPGKSPSEGKEQMNRLAKLKKKHHNNQMTKVDWLDRLTFREIELISEKQKRESEFMYLMIEFPVHHFDNDEYSVIYYEKDGDEVHQFKSQADIVTVPDFEIMQENLVESKHHKLARCLRSGISDKDVKPDASTRDQLNTIVGYPPTKQLTVEEQDLVWKFRFYLSNQKKALAKFLKCVNWHVPTEARQALDLLQKWTPMDVEDALELLGPNFTHPLVRRYAVTRLKQAPDEDLLLYLLQLAQALKYEDFEEIKSGWLQTQNMKEATQVHPVDATKSERSNSSSSSGCATDSNLRRDSLTENPEKVEGPLLEEAIHPEQQEINVYLRGEVEGEKSVDYSAGNLCDLATFLIYRACNNSLLANYFYWYLLIECEDHESLLNQDSQVREMYLTVLKRFSKVLQRGGKEWQIRRTFLNRQQTFIDKLVMLVKTVARESGNRKKKIERLQALLFDADACKFNFANFEPLPFPLDPEVEIKGIIPEEANLFKSAMMPCRLTFLTTQGTKYIALFKHGDDLRQDQLILQIITLMDKLLRKENLDLKLTPYRVLATSSKHGFVQFITSIPVAEVLSTDGSIQNFFRKHNPSEVGPYGIQPEVMDTYVKSCAGYCVITYLLGVGDRHLDNLLLTKSGKMFHIDFGYILGRDPKPMPPPMKLSKEMVEAMGGMNSEYYQEFRKQCYTAFLHLRRHSNLILNLFSLMVDATVPDIALEPDKTVKKVQDKFQLHLSDEEAVHYMQNIIDLSASDMVAVLVEQLHKFAQYWRK